MQQSLLSHRAVGDKGDTEASRGLERVVGVGASHGAVSVGGTARSWTHLSAEPLDLAGLLAAGHHPGAGAVVLFSGEVRDNNKGRAVAFLEYEAYAPMAEKMISAIVAEAIERWALKIAVAVHRTGKLAIGDTAVVVITAAPHRGDAYVANRYIIDRIKHEAPIWKCEHFVDGVAVWGSNCECHIKTGDLSKHLYEPE